MKTSRSSKTAMLTHCSLRALSSGLCLLAAIAAAVFLTPAAPLHAQTPPPASFNGYVMADGDNITFTTSQTYNGAGGGTERLVVPDGVSGTMTVNAGVTAGIINSYANDPVTGTNGGAINIGAGSSLSLLAAPGGYWLFASNSAANNGGAINGSGALFLQNATLMNNHAVATGGAASTGSAGLMDIRDSYFTGNSAASNGGALFVGASSTMILVSDTFAGNTSTYSAGGNAGGGGAIGLGAGLVTGTNLTFKNNYSTYDGGAINASNGATIDLNGALFVSNSAMSGGAGSATTGGGGAIYATPNAASVLTTVNLTNVSFLDNITDNAGGAYCAYNVSTSTLALNLNTTTGNTALIAGNLENYNTTTGAGISNFLYIRPNNGVSASVNITINTQAGSTLDMLDPMYMFLNNTATINNTLVKTGDGTWKISGSNTFFVNGANSGTLTFTASAGMLYFYRAGEQVTSTVTGTTYTASTGNFFLQVNGTPTATNYVAFHFAATSTIGVGGGNLIATNRPTGPNNFAGGTLITDAGSHISYDLSAATIAALGLDPANTLAGSGTALLTLGAQYLTIDDGAKFNFGLNLASATTTGTYNLLQAKTDATTTAPAGTLFATYAGQTFDATTTPISYNNLFYSLTGLDTTDYDYLFGITGNYLWLSINSLITTPPGANTVLTWTGAESGAWGGLNWMNSSTDSIAYTPGDIVNLANLAPATGTTDITLAGGGAKIAGMYVSGTENYTINGTGPILATATAGDFDPATALAATGQLILGASAAPDATTIDTAAYTGTLTLANTTNNFENGIIINTGALVANATNLATTGTDGLPAPIAIGAAGTLTLDQATDATYATPITDGLGGGGTLNKNNTGALTLTADNTTFTGITNVNAGALLLAPAAPAATGSAGIPPAPAALGGDIHVANGATFGGAGAAGNVTLNNGATLQVGLGTGDPALTTLTITTNLNLLDGSILTYNYNDNLLAVGGAITQTGATTINLLGATFATSNSYSLIDLAGGWTGVTFNTDQLNVNYKGTLLAPGANYLFTTDGNLLWLTLLDVPDLANYILTWTNATGAGNNAWLATPNWNTLADGAPKTFKTGDIVNLTDLGAPPPATTATITLADTATAAGIYISGNTNYTITGPGSLVTATGIGDFSGSAAASGQLILGTTADGVISATSHIFTPFNGTLDLTGITGTNNFTQGIRIYSGALRIANPAQLGTTLPNLTFERSGTLIVAGDMLFDGAGGSTQRLAINTYVITPTGSIPPDATLILEPGHTLTIANNNTPGVSGAAINLAANAQLTLQAGAASRYTFTNNTGTNGGAIETGSNATLTLDATAGAGATFTFNANTATNRGGALDINGGLATIDHATLGNNTAIANGGAISTVAGGTLTLANALFTGNRATSAGGALYLTTNALATIQSATFANNTAGTNGGAIAIATGTLNLTDALIANNTAAAGGALLLSGVATANLTDVSIVNNITNATGNGAAIALQTSSTTTLDFNVTAGHTSQIAGNVNIANGVATPYSIYFNYGATSPSTHTININVAADATLDMLDPMLMPSSPTLTITKDGPGAWRLGGYSLLGNAAAPVTIDINAGTLHLLGAGETSTGPAGAFTATTSATLAFNASSANTLTIHSGATLAAGGSGGARVNAPILTLAPDSLLAFNLALAPNALGATVTAANTLLTLNTPTTLNANKWTQTLNLIGIDDLDRAAPATYNLLTLTGASGNANPFTDTSFNNLANTLGGLPPGYTLAITTGGLTLQLLYAATNTDNHVLDWNGAATNTLYGARNWFAASSTTITTYNPGDILNLADAPDATGAIATPAAGALVSGLYVSGTQNYTITGDTPITATATASPATQLADTPAATGKLILGARASSTTIITDDGNGNPVTNPTTTLATAPYTGTLALANTTNNFAGGIEINTGALAGSASSLGSGTVGITNNGTLILDQATDDATYTAPITGAGALVKTGAATLTLAPSTPAPAPITTGPATILAGALLLDNATLGGTLDIATAATAGGAGAIAGNVTLATAATLQTGIGLAGNQTLALLGDLTLADGAILSFATPTDTIHLSGTLDQTGAATINVGLFQSGTYNLGNLGPLANSAITVGGRVQYADARQSVTLAQNNNDLLLIAAGDISRALTWTGATGATWALTGTNWDSPATGAHYVFGNGDRVTFDDTANPTAPATINIIDGVIVSDMLVTNTGNTTITGTAGITSDPTSVFAATGSANLTGATGKLTKTSSGTLTLANTGNDFKNGIDLTAGLLALDTGATHAGGATNIAPNTTLQVSDGALLTADNLQLAPSSTLTTAAGRGTITGNITLNGTIETAILASNTLQLLATTPPTTSITGPGALHKTGAGELELTGPGAFGNTGGVILDAGSLRLDGMPPTGPITLPQPAAILLNNGNLILASGNPDSVDYKTAADWGANLALTYGPTAADTGTITGANDILHIGPGALAPTLAGGLHIAVDAANGTAELTNTANTFTGAIIINTGTYRFADARELGAVNAGATKIALNGGVFEISTADPATPAFAGNIDLHTGTGAITVDPGVSSTWTAITISTPNNTATALKTGSGTLTLTGALAATSLIVDQGRWVAVASTAGAPNAISNNFVGPVTINENAVYELGIPTGTAVSGTLGYFAGRDPAANLCTLTTAGAINNPFTGSGTLEITTGRLNFTSPQTDIAHVNIIGPDTALIVQSMNFSPAGAITIDNASLILAANTQTLGNITLKNNATMGFLRTGTLANGALTLIGPPNKHATIASLAAPALADDGAPNTPNLWFNADVSALAADHLSITGPVTGAFTVNITYEGSATTPPKVAANLELINAPAMGATGTFTIADASREVDIGLYKYQVTDATTPAGAYTLAITGNGDMSNTAAAIYTAAAALPLAWFTELNTVSQRLGALHLENRADKAGLSAWLLGYDEKLNFNDKLTGTPFTQNHYGAEAGVDYKVGDSSAATGLTTGNNVYLGLFAGYGSNQRPNSDPVTSTSDSAFGGLYITAASKAGWYLDLVGKFNNFKNRFAVADPSTGAITTADYRNWAIGASLEVGKHQKLPADWFIEPQAQIAITQIAGSSYQTDNGATISRGAGMASQGRLGFRLGHDMETEKLGAFSFYLKGYYGRQWASDGRMTIVTADGTTGRDKDGNPYYTPAIDGIALTGGAGFTWLFTRSTQVYFDYETTQARYYIRPYGFTLGLRHLW